MSTKLVVSFNGLELTNINQVVSSRNIDEVVLVSTAQGINSFTQSQRASISKIKSTLPQSTNLSLALANDTFVDLNNETYEFLRSNNLSFYNDPGLQSLSSSYVLEESSVRDNLIITDSLTTFDTQTIFNNSLYQEEGSLILGDNFATVPTLSLSNPSFIDDLNGTVKVNISASSFANILSQNTPEDPGNQSINIVEPNNVIVETEEVILPPTAPNNGKNYRLTKEFLTRET